MKISCHCTGGFSYITLSKDALILTQEHEFVVFEGIGSTQYQNKTSFHFYSWSANKFRGGSSYFRRTFHCQRNIYARLCRTQHIQGLKNSPGQKWWSNMCLHRRNPMPTPPKIVSEIPLQITLPDCPYMLPPSGRSTGEVVTWLAAERTNAQSSHCLGPAALG